MQTIANKHKLISQKSIMFKCNSCVNVETEILTFLVLSLYKVITEAVFYREPNFTIFNFICQNNMGLFHLSIILSLLI